MENYRVQYCNLSGRIHGFTTKVPEEEFYIIVINSALSFERQQEALKHELLHIENGDFDIESGDINDIEHGIHSC